MFETTNHPVGDKSATNGPCVKSSKDCLQNSAVNSGRMAPKIHLVFPAKMVGQLNFHLANLLQKKPLGGVPYLDVPRSSDQWFVSGL